MRLEVSRKIRKRLALPESPFKKGQLRVGHVSVCNCIKLIIMKSLRRSTSNQFELVQECNGLLFSIHLVSTLLRAILPISKSLETTPRKIIKCWWCGHLRDIVLNALGVSLKNCVRQSKESFTHQIAYVVNIQTLREVCLSQGKRQTFRLMTPLVIYLSSNAKHITWKILLT
jgi:hypothetical protein